MRNKLLEIAEMIRSCGGDVGAEIALRRLALDFQGNCGIGPSEPSQTWTKTKPTRPGYYWVRMLDTPFQKQPPRVVKVEKIDDGSEWDGEAGWDGTSLMALEGPDYIDGLWVSDMVDEFDWSLYPIDTPVPKPVSAYPADQASGRS